MNNKTQGETEEQILAEEIKNEKIRRAMLAGPSCITAEATVAEMDSKGQMTVLRPGTNDWVCVPGEQNIIGATDMCLDPMGMVWLQDLLAGKPKPTNTSPGLIYMLNGATQHSYTDPFDTTSPAIPIGPQWMLGRSTRRPPGLAASCGTPARWSCSPARPTPICMFAARLGTGMNTTPVTGAYGP